MNTQFHVSCLSCLVTLNQSRLTGNCCPVTKNIVTLLLTSHTKYLSFVMSLLSSHSSPVTLDISLYTGHYWHINHYQSLLTFDSLPVTFDKSLFTIHYCHFTFKLYPFDLSLSTSHSRPVNPDLSLLSYHSSMVLFNCHFWPVTLDLSTI